MVILVALLEGCIALPIPHDQAYSPLLSGTVVDAQTSMPIAGAEIRLEGTTYAPQLVNIVETGIDGRFSLVVTKREFWMLMFLGPAEGHCTATATVSVPGYVSQAKDFQSGMRNATGGLCHRYTETWSVSLARDGT